MLVCLSVFLREICRVEEAVEKIEVTKVLDFLDFKYASLMPSFAGKALNFRNILR
tara:strand:+ start:327 stop:491 length:165 start_codon:yes stop_codon:yes gene_type:complete